MSIGRRRPASYRGWPSSEAVSVRELLAHQELHPAILRPAEIRPIVTQGLLLAEAPDADPGGVDPVRDERVADDGCSTLTESLVVLRGTALVGKALEQHLIAIGLEPGRVGIEHTLVHGPDHRAIQVEVQR